MQVLLDAQRSSRTLVSINFVHHKYRTVCLFSMAWLYIRTLVATVPGNVLLCRSVMYKVRIAILSKMPVAVVQLAPVIQLHFPKPIEYRPGLSSIISALS